MGICISTSVKPVDNISINQNGQITKKPNGTTQSGNSDDTIILIQPKKSSLSKKRTRTDPSRNTDTGLSVFQCWGSVRNNPNQTNQSLKSRLSPIHGKPPPYPNPRTTKALIKPVFLRSKPRFASTPEVFEVSELDYPNGDGESIDGMSIDGDVGTSVSAISSQKSISVTSMDTVMTTVTHHSRASYRLSDKVMVYPYTGSRLKDPVQLSQDFTYYCYGAMGPPQGRTLPIKPASRGVSLRDVPTDRWKVSLQDLQNHPAHQPKQRLKDGPNEYDRESLMTDVSERHGRLLNELVEASSTNSSRRSSPVRQNPTPNRRKRSQSSTSGHGSTTRSTYSNASSRVRLVATPEDDLDRDEAIPAIHDDLTLRRNINNWTPEARVEAIRDALEREEERREKEEEEKGMGRDKLRKRKGKQRRKQKLEKEQDRYPLSDVRAPSPPATDNVSSDLEGGVIMVKEVTHAVIHPEPNDANKPAVQAEVVVEPETMDEMNPDTMKDTETKDDLSNDVDPKCGTRRGTGTSDLGPLHEASREEDFSIEPSKEPETAETASNVKKGTLITVQPKEKEHLETVVYNDPYEEVNTPPEIFKYTEVIDESDVEINERMNRSIQIDTEIGDVTEKDTEKETIVNEVKHIMVKPKEEEMSLPETVKEPETLNVEEETPTKTNIEVEKVNGETAVSSTDLIGKEKEKLETEERKATNKQTITAVNKELETHANEKTVKDPEPEEAKVKNLELQNEVKLVENQEVHQQEPKPDKIKPARVKSPMPKTSKDPTSVIDVIISAATAALVANIELSSEPGVRRMLSVFRQGSSLAAGSAVVDHGKLRKSLLQIFSRALSTTGTEDTKVKDVREDINSLDQQFYQEIEELKKEGNVQDASVRSVFTCYQQKLNLLHVRGLRTSLLHKQKQRDEEEGQLEQEARQLLVELDDVRRSIRDLRGKERQTLDNRLMEKLRSKRHKVAPLDTSTALPDSQQHQVELSP